MIVDSRLAITGEESGTLRPAIVAYFGQDSFPRLKDLWSGRLIQLKCHSKR